MKFERKIFLTYALLIVFIVTVLGVVLRIYIMQEQKQKAQEQLQIIAEKNLQQLDETIKSMRFITDYLLSDFNVLSSFSTLSKLDDTTTMRFIYREEARSTVRKSLLTHGIIKNFYRVSYFNDKNDFITSKFLTPVSAWDSIDFSRIPWIDRAQLERGRPVISGAYADPWMDEAQAQQVFSLGRAMPEIGYIEVQQKIDLVEEILLMESDLSTSAVVCNLFGDIIYSDFTGELSEYYVQMLQESSFQKYQGRVDIVQNPLTSNEEILAYYGSLDSGLQVLLVRDTQSVASVGLLTAFTTAGALIIVLISLAYIYLVAKRLTRPIKALTKQIEQTALENIEQNIPINTTNDEVEALSESYAQLLSRLNRSILNEKHMEILNMQNQFDALNAQINPHFIYNVLNVISYHGMKSGNENICNICSSLADILRYSTDTNIKNTTIQKEIVNLNKYIFLMSNRYQHKLLCTIDIDQQIEQEIVPKLIMQLLVENSITHGYEQVPGVMHISVIGRKRLHDWEIQVRDNGQGFSSEKILEISQQMEKVSQDIKLQNSSLKMEFGGMGLINAYARLQLLYGSQCIFSFRNHEEGGAEVTIGGNCMQHSMDSEAEMIEESAYE